MRTIRHNSREAKLSDMNFFVRVFPCAWLCICLLLSGCNPKSEEQTENDAEQSEAEEQATTTATESESETTVEEMSEQSTPPSDETPNESNAESSKRAAQGSATSIPSQNGRTAGDAASTKSSAGYSMATGLRSRATAYSKKGDSKSAYQTTLAAWQAVRNEKNDKKSQQLSTQLLQDMEKYGEGLKSPVIQNVLQKPVRYE